MEGPGPELQSRAARLIGGEPIAWRRVSGGGYTPAARWIVRTDVGTGFVKIATEATTAWLLRKEADVYARVSGDFMPQFLGFDDDPATPMLAIADLSDARWPPPWGRADITAVLDAARAMHGTPCDVPRYVERHGHRPLGWARRDCRTFRTRPSYVACNVSSFRQRCRGRSEPCAFPPLSAGKICQPSDFAHISTISM